MKLTRKTKRLVIRPLASSDYKAWLHANTTLLPPQNEWDRHALEAKDLTKSKFTQMIKDMKRMRADESFIDLGVFETKTGELIGFVAVMNIVRSVSQSAYIGYRLLNRHWGKGYGKEALRALIDISFRDLKLHRIEAGIEPRNRRSIFLARSAGLRKEGLKKNVIFLRGKWRDLLTYVATTEDFGIKWTGTVEARRRR